MAEDGKQKNYRIECIEDENGNRLGAAEEQPEQLQQDPLDALPDVSSQTGGLPVVTSVLVCLSACVVILIERMLTAASVLFSVCCVGIEAILVFGIVALIRGMFQRLHQQQEDQKWYPISAAVMAAGIAIGLAVGAVYCF